MQSLDKKDFEDIGFEDFGIGNGITVRIEIIKLLLL
jgi:hypothetical protein